MNPCGAKRSGIAVKAVFLSVGMFLLLVAAYYLGGRGSSAGTAAPQPGRTLRWQAPLRFSDGSALDPAKDLSNYEIYLNETGTFTEADSARAVTHAFIPSRGIPVTSFDLSTVTPPLERGKTYFVSMRAIDLSGVRSDLVFPPVRFIY